VPTERLVQISSWSYSRAQTYTQCPRRAKYLYIDKLKEPEQKSPALAHGTRVHALAAAWVSKQLPDFTAWDGRELLQYKPELERAIKARTIPAELERFKIEFARLVKLKAQCEEMWNLDKDWNILARDWSPNTWLRIKVDAHFIQKGAAEVIDYKTGKFNPDHAQQRSIYAIGALMFYPDAKSVKVSHWYLDQGIEKNDTWQAGDLDWLKEDWEKRTTAMLNDTTFAPRPSPDACRYCAFQKARGGPCSF